jgi:hypothetical protein
MINEINNSVGEAMAKKTRIAWKLNDPEESKRRHSYTSSRAQAKFRNESWDLEYQEWLDIWGDLWQQKGKGRDDYCLCRLDNDDGWNRANVAVMTRANWLKMIKSKEN